MSNQWCSNCKPRERYGFVSSNQRQPIAIAPAADNSNFLHISWTLHNLCNQRCSYCAETYWKGDVRQIKFEDIVFFLVWLFRQYRKERYHFSFSGGEPTLWPDFIRLCRFLHSKGCDIGLTSNGSRPASYWLQIADKLNWTCLSYHPEFTRDQEFLEVIKALSCRTRLAVRLMMHQERTYWLKSIDFAQKIRALPEELQIFVEYVPLQRDFGGEKRPWKYEQWQVEFFKENNNFMRGTPAPEVEAYLASKRDVWNFHAIYDDGSRELARPNELVARDQANFQGWTCEAGRELLYIQATGNIYKAGCLVDGRIGRLSDPPKQFPQAPVKCPHDFCSCGADILVSKYAPGYNFKNLNSGTI